MSHILFVDTTIGATIGVIGKNNEWLFFEENREDKPSANFHLRIYEALKQFDLEITDLSSVFHIAGPGSYTGIRLSEGFCQILELNKIKISSCYHFDIPKLLGENNFFFIANAFKGEYFYYKYSNFETEVKLIKKKDFKLLDGKVYSHEIFEDFSVENTLTLIKDNPNLIVDLVQQNTRKEIYYYRAVEDEFVLKEKIK